MEETTFPINIAKKLFKMRNSVKSIPSTGEIAFKGATSKVFYKTEDDILGAWNPAAEAAQIMSVPEIIEIINDPGSPAMIKGVMHLIDLESGEYIGLKMWGLSEPTQQKIAATWTGMVKYMYSKLLGKPSDVDLEDDVAERPSVQTTMRMPKPGEKPQVRI